MTKPKLNLIQSARWTAYAVVTILVLAGIAALAVPPYLIKTLEGQAMQQTGRKLTIDHVGFNLLTLSVNIGGLKFYEANQTDVAFSADELLLKVSPAAVFNLAPVLREVKVVHPNLQLKRTLHDGKEMTNFSDVFAHLAQHPSKGEPVHFSVSNIQVSNGAIQLDDRIANKQVHIDALRLDVPFISNFSNATDVFIAPFLSATVDGSKMELKAKSKPFSADRDTSVAIDIDQFNLTELVPFSPVPLPVQLKSGHLSTHLTLTFASGKSDQHIDLAGTASIGDLQLLDKSGSPLYSTKQISVDLHDANLENQQFVLNSLELIEPQIWVGFDQNGLLNWAGLSQKKAAESVPVPPPKAGATGKQPSIMLTHFQIKNGTAHWSDAANAIPALQMDLPHIEVDAQNFSTKENVKPAKVVASIGVAGSRYVHFDGQIGIPTAAVSGHLTLADLALEDFQPYASHFIGSTLAGKLGLQTELAVHDGNFSMHDFSGNLTDLLLQASRREFGGLSAKKVALEDFSLDTATRQVKMGQINLDQVSGDVFRAADGDINVMHLLTKSQAAKSINQSSQEVKSSQPWQFEIGQIAVNDSQFGFGDKAVQPAVTVVADAVNIKLNDVSSNPANPMKLTMRATLNKTGKFAIDGTASAKLAQINLDVQNFAITVLQPYFTEFLNIKLEKGSISTKGKLLWAAPNQIKFTGGLKLANFLTVDKEYGDDFLNWKLLDISGINVALGLAQPIVTLGQINLNDFYARAILSDKGRLNLQNIVVRAGEPDVNNKPDQHASPKEIAAASQPAPVFAASGQPKPLITIGAINLKNGIVNYTDNFIKPHYSMRMTGMNGSIGTIQSNLAQSAPININGKVDDEAPIALSGSLNPLFSPMLLDIRMTATGVDLPKLTTYALKYAGYPIVKGKLSLDVEYHIKDNHLEANNSLKIDQLTFGDRVEGPDATHLPVPFLISLLTDSNGQINLDLPISGTINDPQFSIGGLIVQVFVNMIEKVVTSPFTLLSHAFGGGEAEELAYIEFEPGSFKLTDAAKAKLDTLAKGLVERPAVKLDMIGRADMATDNAGLRAFMLERQIKRSRNHEDDSGDSATMTEALRARAIDKIYSDAKFDKPRNALGFAKTLPIAEMEKLILANTVVTDDDIRALALRRESAVRAYLTDASHIPADRLFSIAPKLSGDGIKDNGAISRVDLELKM